MEDLLIHLDRPEISDVYIFGSYLKNANPDDVDILIIYNEAVCAPRKAHKMVRPVILELEMYFRLNVHLTLLSNKEISHNDFINLEDCVSLKGIIRDN
jgi:predicted nucleotidyltransferase